MSGPGCIRFPGKVFSLMSLLLYWLSSCRNLCRVHTQKMLVLAAVLFIAGACVCAAQVKPDAGQDELVLANGDVLHGKLVDAIDGVVTFHTTALGDVEVKWKNVKSLHSSRAFAVFNKNITKRSRSQTERLPVGPVDVQNNVVTIYPKSGAAPAPTPIKEAAFVVDQVTLEQQVYHQPNFFAGWDGAATAGVTLVQATQNQYTESGSVGVVRTVPSATWLRPRNRTSADFSGSFGKITQPATPTIKAAIFHAGAERDQYFSSRFFALAQVAFDHNFGQLLALQSVYGGGIGFTALETPAQQLDLKSTVQYEKQEFLAPPPPGVISPSHDLIGSTFSFSYALKLKLLTFTQKAAFIPAYNTPRAYSASETNAVTFPVYKNFGFTLGTLDSYLNDPPISTPPTKANSFQFTMGLTYAFKSKY